MSLEAAINMASISFRDHDTAHHGILREDKGWMFLKSELQAIEQQY